MMDPLWTQLLEPASPSTGRLARDLQARLRDAILSGRLAAGLRLPSTRALAQGLGVARNTVIAVYDGLLGEGYLEARRGSGHRVAVVLPAPRARAARQPAAAWADRLVPAWRGVAAPAEGGVPAATFDFRLGMPDTRSLRWDLWRRLAARSWRDVSRAPADYGPPQGQPALRAAIAGHVSQVRALACHEDEVLVTAGAQQAFDLLARVLVTPGRTVVAVEHPGYPPARRAFANAGARIVHVPVDDEGLVVECLPADARVVMVTPSHQFPLGCAMSLRRRRELLAFARRHHALIVEDDYDGEFRYDGRALDALATLDRDGCVAFVGTFSKSLFPALRLGYVVAPSWLLGPLIVARQQADWHGPRVAQDTLAAFIAQGHLARHVRHMQRVYAQRREALLQALNGPLARWLDPVPGAAGLHLAARSGPALDARAVVAAARRRGLVLSALDDYAVRGQGARGQAPRGLLFGFGPPDVDTLERGLYVLAGLLGTVAPRP